jgi:hypothetical protein
MFFCQVNPKIHFWTSSMKFSKNFFCLKKKTSSRLLFALPKISFWKGKYKERDCLFLSRTALPKRFLGSQNQWFWQRNRLFRTGDPIK